jgi:drug/metabolite transporter (DMT)-like permease
MSKSRATISGFVALLLWSGAAAFTRTLSEDLGAFTAAACVHLVAGVIAVAYQHFYSDAANRGNAVPRSYWITCGSFFVLYVICAYLSVALAQTREQVIVIILIKFLWPLLTLLFTVPIQKAKASGWLYFGLLFSLAGIVVATLGSEVSDFAAFRSNLTGNILPYLIGLLAAASWALYSNFSRRLAGESNGGVGYFILTTGLLLGAISLTVSEPRNFSGHVFMQMSYQALFATFLATILWDTAMRKGNIVLVSIVSNFLPLLTVVVSALLLGVQIGMPVWLGTSLVIVGTFVSKQSFGSAVASSLGEERVL